jgi:hypothetical protein
MHATKEEKEKNQKIIASSFLQLHYFMQPHLCSRVHTTPLIILLSKILACLGPRRASNLERYGDVATVQLVPGRTLNYLTRGGEC